jgi:hypothetical protein
MALERRGLLRGLVLAVPAALAGLQVVGSAALADEDDRGRGRGGGRGRDDDDENENRNQNQNQVRRNSASFSADLVATNTVSGDFSGVGDTGSGSLTVFSNANAANSISVSLRGATANTTYTLIFASVGGSRSGGLGSFTTNAAGNADAFFNGALSEAGSATSSGLGSRVGVFVLTKSAGDAFVTAA